MPNRLPKLASTLIATILIVPTSIQFDWDQAAPAGRSVTEQASPIDIVGAVVSPNLPVAAESAPAAIIAWNGCVFISNADGDDKVVKDRIYALGATTCTYQCHFKLVPKDWHDLDVSSVPTDGYPYGFDLYTNTLLYRVPVIRTENVDANIEISNPAHSCPGTWPDGFMPSMQTTAYGNGG
jgi:hypothetical protein